MLNLYSEDYPVFYIWLLYSMSLPENYLSWRKFQI